jgi:hypothetical protein
MTINQLRVQNLAPRGVRGCCVPTSICFVTGVTYQDVDYVLKKQITNYREGYGVYTEKFLGEQKILFGYRFTKLDWCSVNVWRFRTHVGNQGTYLVCIKRHMFVVKDGDFFDLCTTNDFAQVLNAWKVEKIS